MNTYALTDVGRQRETNEDTVSVTVFERERLLVVADGMGGRAAGDVASESATAELTAYVSTALSDGRTDYEAILDEAITTANEEIRAVAEANVTRASMGTTVVAALVANGVAVIANVGDSRAYIIDDDIERVTLDQSFVRELVEQGEITEDKAETHPQRNVISQALGTSEMIEPDFYRQSVGGTLLLCSDGLTEEVSETVIAEMVADAPDLESAADSLLETAKTNGGSDNISIILCR